MAVLNTIQLLTKLKTWILGKIGNIANLIPSQASPSNQLADKAFVNSSIATATATFRGTYNVVSDLSLAYNATHVQIEAALATKMTALSIIADSNDYAFVQVPTSNDTPTEIARIERYKFNGTFWGHEYSLNNSGFTSSQWDAINSGVTNGDMTKLRAMPTNSELTALLNGKQDVIQDLASIRSGASAGATAVQPEALSSTLTQTVAESGVFDLSAHNAVGGVLATYADLSSAITALNAIESKYKCGGMSIKFVQSSDNKYVQHRYTGTAVNGTPNPFLDTDNWQKQGAEVSITQVKQYGDKIADITIGNTTTAIYSNINAERVGGLEFPILYEHRYVNLSGGVGTIAPINSPSPIDNNWNCFMIEVNSGGYVIINGNGGNVSRLWAILDADYTIIAVADSNLSLTNFALSIPSNAKYVVVNSSTTEKCYYVADNTIEQNAEETKSITNSKVENGAINLIDHSKLLENKGILSNGTIATQNGYCITDFIPVNGENIISNCLSSQYWGGAVYDKNHAFIRSLLNTRQYNYQSGDVYVRLTFAMSTNEKMANYGTSLLPYVEYNPVDKYISNLRESISSLELKGLNVVSYNKSALTEKGYYRRSTGNYESNEYTSTHKFEVPSDVSTIFIRFCWNSDNDIYGWVLYLDGKLINSGQASTEWTQLNISSYYGKVEFAASMPYSYEYPTIDIIFDKKDYLPEANANDYNERCLRDALYEQDRKNPFRWKKFEKAYISFTQDDASLDIVHLMKMCYKHGLPFCPAVPYEVCEDNWIYTYNDVDANMVKLCKNPSIGVTYSAPNDRGHNKIRVYVDARSPYIGANFYGTIKVYSANGTSQTDTFGVYNVSVGCNYVPMPVNKSRIKIELTIDSFDGISTEGLPKDIDTRYMLKFVNFGVTPYDESETSVTKTGNEMVRDIVFNFGEILNHGIASINYTSKEKANSEFWRYCNHGKKVLENVVGEGEVNGMITMGSNTSYRWRNSLMGQKYMLRYFQYGDYYGTTPQYMVKRYDWTEYYLQSSSPSDFVSRVSGFIDNAINNNMWLPLLCHTEIPATYWDAVFDYIDAKISGGYNIQYCTWKDMYDKYNGSLLDKTLNPLDYDA